MGNQTGISWTDATWNPIRGCSKVSAGCAHCYAEKTAHRFSGEGQPYEGLVEGGNWNGRVVLVENHLEDPLRWAKPRRVFVNSMSDLFHDSVLDEWIDRIFDVMARATRHQFQVLTKRPARMRDYLKDQDEILPNVLLGVSAEDQSTADERIPILLETPAAVRFVSCEPLLSAVSLSEVIGGLDWVIVGGESGPGARPIHPDWVRGMRDECVEAEVPFHFKQWGTWRPIYDRDEDPDARRIPRVEWPKGRWLNISGGHGFHGERVVAVRRSDKAKNGRDLDRQVWDQFPGGAA